MTQIGSVYGQALYDLAREEGLDQPLLEQLKALRDSFAQEPDFLRLLSAPNLSKEDRCRIADDSFRGKVHPYVLNFLKILTEKGYARHFGACAEAYREQYNRDHGILPVKAVTAVALTPEQADKLSAKLAGITGKTVELTNRVDPDCLGGVRLDYDGKRVDDTVSHRLDAIRAMLKNTVL
ncbi:MAG: ATP synthase F1 subunit delta [Oscillospiraceae bacterium]|nr:ATP synthase F1 subunit delta [Oscillospiraceae bacterium]